MGLCRHPRGPTGACSGGSGCAAAKPAQTANPTAMLLAVKLMLDWLGETETAQALEQAIADVIAEGKARTYDLGGDNTTLEVAQAMADRL